MELTDIMALVKAGYTKDEIAQMERPILNNPESVPMAAPESDPEPTAAPANEPITRVIPQAVPVPAAASVPAPQPVPAPVQDQPSASEIMQSIAKLTSIVQAQNIQQSVLPNGVNMPKAEDMLAEIIRPTYGGNKND